ncbi:MAG: enoyl-CoA hydratase/isomerase family protein [Rhodospirillales bacterium]|nr:enoyl-CoA hydratase/isomerase family protein [Rhodospirillales bacterium]
MTDLANARQIRLARLSPSYWRVTFDHPPLDIFGPETIPQLEEAIESLEQDWDVKVVVFDSAVEGFFLTHYDFLAKLEDSTSLPLRATGLQPLPDMLARLGRAPVVSIASIRGRATGVGSELALASDMRFASREKAILSQWEVGAGLVPGGGPMARLPRLIGRGRALEVLLSADDIGGDLAERYGYVNRSLPDAELDGFVDALARRIASFDKQAHRRHQASGRRCQPAVRCGHRAGVGRVHCLHAASHDSGAAQGADGARLPQTGRRGKSSRALRRPARHMGPTVCARIAEECACPKI